MNERTRIKRMLKWTIVSTVGLLLAGCGGASKTEPAKIASERRIESRVEEIGQAKVAMTAQASGTVEAKVRSVIAAQVMGTVRQVRVETGQTVRAGDVLIVIDSKQLESGAAQASAARQEAKNALGEVAAMIENARSQLELARSTEARLRKLYDRKSLSEQEMDEAASRVKQAEAGLRMAEARQTQVEARIAQSDQVVKTAETQKGYATLVAPYAGIVTEKIAQVGTMAVPGAPLLVLERQGGLRAALSVDESLAAGLRVGTPLKLTIEGREAISARVSEIVPALDAATRSLIVKADLPAMAELRSGAFVRGEWTTGERETLSLPTTAIRETGQLQMVYVLEDGKARSRMISAGAVTGGRREILSGLKAGEKILLDITDDTKDGATVEVRQ